MIGKSTAIALGLLAALLAATAPSSAMAETGGHFTSESATTTITGTENSTHFTELSIPGLNGIRCTETSYTATMSAATVTEVTVTPKYAKCETTNEATEIIIDLNGCAYNFTIGKRSLADNTVDLECSGEKKYIGITHEGCEIRVPVQNGLKGVSYETIIENGKHAITLKATLSGLTTNFEAGFCVLLGTSHTSNLTGSVTVTGSNAGSPVGITATGSEDEPKFHSEVTHWFATGSATSTNSYKFGELVGSVECSGATFDGTSATQESASLTIQPIYSECTGVSKRVVTAHVNGCAYILTLTVEGTDGTVDIECPEGKSIETVVDKFPEEGCTLTVGPQTAGGTVDYKGEGSGSTRELILTWTLTGLNYKRDGCEIGGEGNNGTMTGTVTLEGEDTSGTRKGLWIE